MGLRKKKNIITLTICMVISFILYQLYFFLSITSASSGDRVIPVHVADIENIVHVRPESDKYINNHGVIKGVLYYTMLQYRPDAKGDFKCLKSDQYIPFEQVNDDYCDCDDSSDEPSTNACVNGTFYCDNQSSNKRVAPNSVPSSKVNDGICDCCDGSDEWLQENNVKLLSQANKRHYRYYGSKCLNLC
ncbi:uncharacterized protein LOC133515756 [Cydia pomonella]|uniref:uncharacterized protein LOC133515756 n=1 Tax=Cydia pomonella TaxID=82600 RepID=UPI002ADE94E6|nr:uncharacterized protein LOC133515756 [Cydia pomonella]